MRYSWERFFLDLLLTAVLSVAIYFGVILFGYALAYGFCLLIAAVFVFLGEVLVIASASGDWDIL